MKEPYIMEKEYIQSTFEAKDALIAEKTKISQGLEENAEKLQVREVQEIQDLLLMTLEKLVLVQVLQQENFHRKIKIALQIRGRFVSGGTWPVY